MLLKSSYVFMGPGKWSAVWHNILAEGRDEEG